MSSEMWLVVGGCGTTDYELPNTTIGKTYKCSVKNT